MMFLMLNTSWKAFVPTVLNASDLSSIDGSVPGNDINKIGSSLLVSVNNLLRLRADGKISGRPTVLLFLLGVI